MRKTCVTAAVLGAFVLLGAQQAFSEGKAIVWHGYAQTRLMNYQGDFTRLKVERLSLSAQTQLQPDLNAYIEVYHHPALPPDAVFDQFRHYLESAYLNLKLEDGSNLRVGRGRRMTFGITPSIPGRKFSNYGLTSSTFTMARVNGVQYFFDKGGYDGGVGITTTHRIGGSVAGDVSRPGSARTSMISDKDIPNNINTNLELSARFGAKQPNGTRYGITGSTGRLDNTDLNYMNAQFTGTYDSKRKTRLGAYFQVPVQEYLFQGEYFDAQTSNLDHDAWYLIAGYKPKSKAYEAYLKYEESKVDAPANANSASWNKKQYGFTVVKPLQKGVDVRLEVERNEESPGGGAGSVRNDVAFIELFTAF